jgi:dolichol-phosphate mannosyltransferase
MTLAAPDARSAVATTPETPTLLRDRWACPRCRARALRETPATIDCPACGASYAREQGVPLFLQPVTAPPAAEAFDLTVVVLALNERENLRRLLPDIREALAAEGMRYELLVVDGGSSDGTRELAAELGARVHAQKRRGYGGAVAEALQIAGGRFVLMMDGDLSHPARVVADLWRARERGDLVVASRYVPGAKFDAPWMRKVLSRILNITFTRALSLPINDVSSGFRLYRAEAMRGIELTGTNFETLEELLIKAHHEGRRLSEIAFHYEPRREGQSHVRFFTFAVCFLKTLYRMWALRSSMSAADYEDRAFRSRIPLQRLWQRARHRVVMDWIRDRPGAVLDVGCGSGRVVQELPQAVGLDPLAAKLRYVARRGATVAQGSVFDLPFAAETFETVVCNQVIEHLPEGPQPFTEIARVLKPGGAAVVGTPDFGCRRWRVVERLYKRLHPNSTADEHLSRYTRETLEARLRAAGLEVAAVRYVMGAEVNVLARKRP